MELFNNIQKEMEKFNDIYVSAYKQGVIEGRRQVWEEVNKTLSDAFPKEEKKESCPSA